MYQDWHYRAHYGHTTPPQYYEESDEDEYDDDLYDILYDRHFYAEAHITQEHKFGCKTPSHRLIEREYQTPSQEPPELIETTPIIVDSQTPT